MVSMIDQLRLCSERTCPQHCKFRGPCGLQFDPTPKTYIGTQSKQTLSRGVALNSINEASTLFVRPSDEQRTGRIAVWHGLFDAVFFPTQQSSGNNVRIASRRRERLIASVLFPYCGILPRYLIHRALPCVTWIFSKTWFIASSVRRTVSQFIGLFEAVIRLRVSVDDFMGHPRVAVLVGQT